MIDNDEFQKFIEEERNKNSLLIKEYIETIIEIRENITELSNKPENIDMRPIVQLLANIVNGYVVMFSEKSTEKEKFRILNHFHSLSDVICDVVDQIYKDGRIDDDSM